MLNFFKNIAQGLRVFPKSNSVQVTSKLKKINQEFKPQSLDSKQKNKNLQLSTSKKYPFHEVISLDATSTMKKYSQSSKSQKKTINFIQDSLRISNVQVDDQKYEDLLLFPDLNFNSDVPFSNGIIVSAKKNNQIQRQKIITQSTKHPQRNIQKTFLKRESIKKRKPINERCSICNKTLALNDSLQLACTHRYHKGCANQMQWRMRYKCDLCQIKRDHKKSSIILRNISRKRKNKN